MNVIIVNKLLFKRAIQLQEFQEFMTSEIKVTNEEIEKLKGCRKCLSNFSWEDRAIINNELDKLDKENKLEAPKAMKSLHKIFTKEQKNEALKFIQGSDADFFQIILRKKQDR